MSKLNFTQWYETLNAQAKAALEAVAKTTEANLAQMQAEAFKAVQLLAANASQLRVEAQADIRKFKEYLQSEEFEDGLEELARRLKVSFTEVDPTGERNERIRAKVRILFETSREEVLESFAKGAALAGMVSFGKRKGIQNPQAILVLGTLFAVPAAGQRMLHILDIFFRKRKDPAPVIPIKR